MTDQRLDDRISRIVQSLDRNVSAEVEAKIRAAADSRRGRHAGRWRPGPLWLALVPGAAVVLLAALILLPGAMKKTTAPISEIRTEFELAGKDIKIIFFQKPDFNLYVCGAKSRFLNRGKERRSVLTLTIPQALQSSFASRMRAGFSPGSRMGLFQED